MSALNARLVVTLGLWALLTATASAAAPNFRQVELPFGISLDVPAHWHFIEEDGRKNLVLVGQTSAEAAGLEDLPAKVRLLAVNATPSPTGAMIGISVSWDVTYTQQDFAQITRTELAILARASHAMFRSMEVHGGPKVIEMQGATVESFNGQHALVLRYRRSGQRGPSAWQVTQYKIPVDGALIELTLSYRESDGPVWRPLLARVQRSVRF